MAPMEIWPEQPVMSVVIEGARVDVRSQCCPGDAAPSRRRSERIAWLGSGGLPHLWSQWSIAEVAMKFDRNLTWGVRALGGVLRTSGDPHSRHVRRRLGAKRTQPRRATDRPYQMTFFEQLNCPLPIGAVC